MPLQNSNNHASLAMWGDGSGGALIRAGTVTESNVIQATTYTVAAGATVTPAAGRGGVVILARESITIEGTISANGIGGGTLGGAGQQPGPGGAGGAGGTIAEVFKRVQLYLGIPYLEANFITGNGGTGGASSGAPRGGGGGGGGWFSGADGGAAGTGLVGAGSPGAGGLGGGYIILCAPRIIIGGAGSIQAQGGNGFPTGTVDSGGGGGGAGGTIICITNQSLGTTGTSPPSQFNVNGGNGGSSAVASGGAGGTASNVHGTTPATPASGGGGGGGGAYGQLIFRTMGGI